LVELMRCRIFVGTLSLCRRVLPFLQSPSRLVFGSTFLACLTILAACAPIQCKFLFYPTHNENTHGLTSLTPWSSGAKLVGYCRVAPDPENIWLLLHGNAGQAADRGYALHCFSDRDSVFIMEYPGYGARPGKPSKNSFDTAAAEAYALLRKQWPNLPVCVVGESIGSGPACTLANRPDPPDKLVLIVPFDTLKSVASEHAGSLAASLFLSSSWDNVASLSHYQGTVEIFGAADDKVIPIGHARRLACRFGPTLFHLIPGGHNEWSEDGRVLIRNTPPAKLR
jgi:hypothetical protein